MKRILAVTASVAVALSLAACGNTSRSASNEKNSVSSSKRVVKHHGKKNSNSSRSSSSTVSSNNASSANTEQNAPVLADDAQSNSSDSDSQSVNAESTSVDDEGNTHHITMSGQVVDGHQLGTDIVTTPDGQSRRYEFDKAIDD